MDYPQAELDKIQTSMQTGSISVETFDLSPEEISEETLYTSNSNLIVILVVIGSAILTFIGIMLCFICLSNKHLKKETKKIRLLSERSHNSELRKSYAESFLESESIRHSLMSKEGSNSGFSNPNHIVLTVKCENKMPNISGDFENTDSDLR